MSKKIVIRYFGNSAFQITTEERKKVLIDPCLTGVHGRGVTKFNTDDIEGIDVIFVTHAGSDHLGDTCELARQMKSQVVCDPAVFTYLSMQGLSSDTLKVAAWGMTGTVAGVRFQVVESSHISFLMQPPFPPTTGCSNGYIIYSESGRGIYHPGDTSIFSDLELFGRLYQPEIAMLGIGGFPPHWGELSPSEAALVAKWMKLKAVIPHHYQPGSPVVSEFIHALRKESPDTQAIVLNHGEEVEL